MPLSGRPIMPHSARLPGQLGWRAVMAAGGSARARVPARRSASSGRYRPAMCHTRSAEYAAGIPAAVTDNGRTEDPRTTGTAWWLYGTGLGHAGHQDAGLGVSPGLLARALTGIPATWPAVGGVSTGAIAAACATGRFRRKPEEQRGPEHRGQSSCSRRHASA
jgi:hypothetical protein